jgi:6-phosphogluconate dehydrogenase
VKVGIVGLGRIGNAVAQRLINANHAVFGYDVDPNACNQAADIGVTVVKNLEMLAKQAHTVWLFLPAGKLIDQVLYDLAHHLAAGAIIIDGGNSNFTDSQERARMLGVSDIFFIDCGTSGGLQGRGEGFCLMVGGDEAVFTKIRPMLEDVAAPGGVGYVGPSGAGHYTKMVHNAIEYAVLQAYCEGMQLLKEGSFKDQNLDLEEITRIWQHGSVIRSWILDLMHTILERDQKLVKVSGEVGETGTGRWAVENARENDVPVPVINKALEVRAQSRETGGNYATKLVALLRHEFGGHPYSKK